MKFNLKKFICFCLALLMILSSVSCSNPSADTTSSSLKDLGSEEIKTSSSSEATEETTKASQTTTATEITSTETTSTTSEEMIWIPNSGTKYHTKATCSNMKNPSRMTLSEAKQSGYEPCSKCH